MEMVNLGVFVGTLAAMIVSILFFMWAYQLREKSSREIKRGVILMFSVKELMFYGVGTIFWLFGFAAVLPVIGLQFTGLPWLVHFSDYQTVVIYNTFHLDNLHFEIYYFILVPVFLGISAVGIRMYERHAAILDAIDRIREEEEL